MITITAILNAIEAHAERAIVPELRLIKKEVEKLRPSLYPDDQEHADALLLKLDRLLSDQVVVATEAGTLMQGYQAVAHAAQQRYVIDCGEGYTCLGFANARDHANQIASKLSRANLAFTDEDYATLAGYDKYLKAIQAWSQSPLTRTTYFDPGTDAKAARVLESCRTHERKVRLILGDTSTGEPWLEEHDVIGRIGRSTGSLKVPLLIEPGEHGGCAILCACLLAIVDWESGDFLYRHAAYREADLSIKPSGDADRSWNVLRREEVVASFRDIGKAGAYLAFMRGATIEPRVFR